ncbi:GNAT family N-acetyltransferase [uncultured Nitrospira sp.]|uniref:GNAT family N-acetyltransferase n=1 Tax=uncultured Nitrospira sp. TaxID=157176 RepID=UPI0031407775
MRIRTIHNILELDSIKDVWKVFERVSGGPTVFQSWTWNRIWCDQVLADDPQKRLAVKLVEDSGGRPVAILPFFEQKIMGSILQITQFLGHRMSTYNDVLLADPNDMELCKDVVEALCSEKQANGFIHLRQMSDESIFAKELIVRGLAEPQCQRAWVDADPKVLDPLSRVSKSRRKHIRHAERSLREKGKVEYRACRENEFMSAFDELIDLHCRRFLQKGKETNLTSQNVGFLRKALTTLSHQGQAEVLQLRFNDATIAGVLQIIDRNRYYSLQSGFDPAFADYSPIWLLDVESMHRGFTALGCTRYELGAVYNEYKKSWNPSLAMSYVATFNADNWLPRIAQSVYRKKFRRDGQRLGV